jgi:hypothetical protein
LKNLSTRHGRHGRHGREKFHFVKIFSAVREEGDEARRTGRPFLESGRASGSLFVSRLLDIAVPEDGHTPNFKMRRRREWNSPSPRTLLLPKPATI